MTRTTKSVLLSAAAFVFAGAASAGALAQQQTPPPPAAQQEAAPATEQEVKQFAKADKQIAKLTEEWQPKVQEAGSPQEAQQLQQAAQAEMVKAIEKEGLTVDRYNQIYAQAQADPALAERIRASA